MRGASVERAVATVRANERYERAAIARAKRKSRGRPAKTRGQRLSMQRCYCGKRITMLAKDHNDPYCTRTCMERALGIVKKTDTMLAEEAMHFGVKARAAKR